MPIQFQCSTCGKPIEVDDEFAGQAVTCPYCRKVMNAPTGLVPPAVTSTTAAYSGPQVASAGPIPQFTPPAQSNWFASASLVCSIVVLLCLCLAFAGSYKVMKRMAPDLKLQQDQMPAFVEQTSKEPMLVVSSIVTLIASIAGVLFAILGLVRRTGRRWQSILSLIVCGLMLACGCLSIMSNFAAMASGKGH